MVGKNDWYKILVHVDRYHIYVFLQAERNHMSLLTVGRNVTNWGEIMWNAVATYRYVPSRRNVRNAWGWYGDIPHIAAKSKEIQWEHGFSHLHRTTSYMIPNH